MKKEKYAQDAINQFVQKSCVFILPGEADSVASDVGSGIIFITPKKRIVVLTAEHIAKNAKREAHRLGYYRCIATLNDFVAGILPFPGDVDVALLLVKDSLSSNLVNLAVSTNSVPHTVCEIHESDSLILCGYPSDLSNYNSQQMEQGFILLTYWSDKPLNVLDKQDRYRLEWGDAQVWQTDEPLNLPSPEGISGGPLWCFSKPQSNSLWSPDGISKIVGVQSAWYKKTTVILEPVSKWGAWFQESIKKIDRN